MSTSSIQEITRTFHSRKFLIHSSFNQSYASTLTSVAPPPSIYDPLKPTVRENSFGANTVLVLTVLLCTLICSLGLNPLISCALKSSRLISSDDDSRNGSNSGATVGKLANQGIGKTGLKSFPIVSYSADLKIPGLENVCVICLAEFTTLEKIRILPKCNHGFHVKCIDKWLNCHTSCPTCRCCLIQTSQKFVGCTAAPQLGGSDSLPGSPRESTIRIAPLEAEGVIRNCHS